MIQFCFSCVFFVYIKIISYSTETSFSFPSCRDKLTEEVKHPIHIFLLGLHTTLRNSGWSMILFTRQHEKQRNVTIESLISAGYGGWSTLIMRWSTHALFILISCWYSFNWQPLKYMTLCVLEFVRKLLWYVITFYQLRCRWITVWKVTNHHILDFGCWLSLLNGVFSVLPA